MSTLMMPAATMTTMTNTSPIAVTQPKAGANTVAAVVAASDPSAAKMGIINNNKQGKGGHLHKHISTYNNLTTWYEPMHASY